MNGYTHKIGGTCAGLIATCLALQAPVSPEKIAVSALIVTGATIGSLLPDIDHKNSTISKKHKVVSWVITHLFEHRGFTHAPLIQVLFTVLLLYLGRNLGGAIGFCYLGFAIGIGLGLLSHTLLDMLTVGGIPLLYPFTKKKFRLLHLKTGKHSGIVAILLIIATIMVIGAKLVFTFLI